MRAGILTREPNEVKIHRSRRANSNADDSYCSSPENGRCPMVTWQRSRALTAITLAVSAKYRLLLSFHRALLSSDVTLPYPIPPHHHYGWPDTDISLVGTIKTVVAVTPRPWLLCLEMKVPSIQSFCCSIGSGCMLPGLDFAQLCRSLGQWQDFFRLRK